MTSKFKLYWTREDGQGEFEMGTFATEVEAEAAIEAARAELIAQCPGPHVETNDDFVKCRNEINAGTFDIEAE